MTTYKTYKDDLYEFTYADITYDTDKIHPELEQQREQIINGMQITFNKVVREYIPDGLIKSKHSVERTLDTTLSRFIMLQMSENLEDPVIPSKINTYDSLINDLDVMLKGDPNMSKDDRQTTIDDIIKELNFDKICKSGIQQLKDASTKLSNNPKIYKDKQQQYTVLKYNNDTVEIYFKLYNKMRSRYNSKYEGDVDTLIWCLIKRYIYLKSYNQQLAVHPDTMTQLKNEYTVQFELFGSVLNTTNIKYCSLFYDIEKYFGSYGSLFFFNPIKGSYSMNPPFDEFLIEKSSKIITEALDASNQHLRIFVWIPIWDKEGIDYLNKNCHLKFKIDASKYGRYKGLDILKKSDKYKCEKRICLQDITYFDYMWYKKRLAANTYLIVMDNKDADCKKIVDRIRLSHR